MNDKELDDFFRKQSEHRDIPYREEDWEKLRKKLDKAPEINGSKRGNKGWSTGLLLLAIIGGIVLVWTYLGDQNHSSTTDSATSSTTLALSDDEEKMEGPQESGKRGLEAADGSSLELIPPHGLNQSVPLKEEDRESVKNERSFSLDNATPGSDGRPAAVQLRRSHLPTIDSKTPPIQWLEFDTSLLGLDKIKSKVLIRKHDKDSHSVDAETEKKKILGSRFFTTFTIAPDVSALKIKDIQGIGNSVGLNLEYFFHPNISINAGAIYVFKTYQAGDGYSTGYIPAPSQVNGNCWVLDLPLNLRFYAFDQRLSRWYMTVGLSSYLMLKEKYELEYKSYNYGGNGYGNSLEVQNKNKHYLNIINLGIGYERVLTDRLSLQVEPYLKLPLHGIGEGDITLKSAGAFVGLKYGW
jgi:outer membrane protein W